MLLRTSRDLPALFAIGSLFPRTVYTLLKELGATYTRLKAICENLGWDTVEKVTHIDIKHTIFNQRIGDAYLTRSTAPIQTQEPFNHPMETIRVNVRTNALAWIQTTDGETSTWNSIQATIKNGYNIKQTLKEGCLSEEMEILKEKFWEIVSKKQTRAEAMLDALTSCKERRGATR